MYVALVLYSYCKFILLLFYCFRCVKVIQLLQSCCEQCEYKSTHCGSVAGLLKNISK
ncbi:hypothetical protein PR202_ga03839 [Eleusine coracana subsp. coracana]|uniref:Uncharacterized protein n=1 Tax=Eleusine coracana subsp. coracana TaxID=191504 RepID=A0AAV5BQ46_ELECO|nr:hypothetical protein PR202_ga03839 [Eleusine coracana subsp. coracana]